MGDVRHPCRLKPTDLYPLVGLQNYGARRGRFRAEIFMDDVSREHGDNSDPFGHMSLPRCGDHSAFLVAYNFTVMLGGVVAYASHTGALERLF